MQPVTFIDYARHRKVAVALLVASVLFATSSHAQQHCTGCGVAYERDRIYKPERNAFVISMYQPDSKRLYYDSMMIFERHRIVSNTDLQGRETYRVDIIGYTLADFRRKTFSNYTSFSDTARKAYIMDEGFGDLGDAASSFFSKKKRSYERCLSLPDTVIGGIRCSRLRGFSIKKGDTIFSNVEYHVNMAKLPIVYMNTIQIGGKSYAIIRTDYYDAAGKFVGYNTTDIVSNNLSKEEIKVFEAWRKNAAKAGVKKKDKSKRQMKQKK